jgi:hypothetical protein
MQSRTAAYFHRFSKVSSQMFHLKQIVRNDAERAKNLIEHKAELDRIYQLIEESARGGGIRVFIAHSDPFWENENVKQELRLNGFLVSRDHHSHQGAIEWYHAKDNELQ